MGNCLKTQLKESVQNSGLLKIGEIKAKVISGSTTGFDIVSTNPVTIKNIDGLNFVGESTSELSGTSIHAVWGQNSTVSLISKYDLVYLNSTNPPTLESPVLSMEDINYLPNVVGLKLPFSGHYSDISSNSSIQSLELTYSTAYGDIANFNKLANLTKLLIGSNYNGDYIVGDIANLGNLTHLTKIKLADAPGVEGSIENFVKGQRESGRATGEILTQYFHMTKCTFNGEQIAWTGSADITLSWDATTITYGGITINA